MPNIMMQDDDIHKFREVRFLNRQLELLEQDKQNLSTTVKRLQAENNDHVHNLHKLKETNERVKRMYDRKEQEFCQLIHAHKSKKGIKAEEKRQLLEQLAEVTQQVEDCELKIGALELLKQNLLTENERLRIELNSVKASDNTVELQNSCETLSRELEALKEENFSLGVENDILGAKNAQIHEKLLESAKIVDFCAKLQLHTYFKGEIIGGAKNGLCEERDDNFHFKGAYAMGKRCGKGKLHTDNLELNGNFVDNMLHGKGELRDNNLSKVLKGNFVDGNFVGNSFMLGRVRYNGCIRDNKANGRGYFEFSNGFVFEGHFSNDEIEKDALGIVYRPETGDEWQACIDGSNLRISGLGMYNIDYASGQLKVVETK